MVIYSEFWVDSKYFNELHILKFFLSQGAKTGLDNGFTILLDVESFDYKFFKEGSTGLKVALVHHLDMPIMRQTGFHISPGTENQIAITPTLLSTSPVLTYRNVLKLKNMIARYR